MKNNSFDLLSILIKGVLLTLLLFFLLASLIVFLNSYEEFVDLILSITEKQHRKEEFIQRFLSREKFQIIRAGIIASFLVSSFLTFWFYRRISSFSERLIIYARIAGEIIYSGFLAFRTLSIFQKSLFFLLFIFIVFFRIKHLFIYPLTNDEIFTWLYFVKTGFLTAGSYYPAPNNHILYSLSCNFIDIFIDNERLVLRLPSLAAGLISVLVLFLYFLKRYSFSLAFLIVVFYSSFINIFFYSFHGRGYVFLYLFFILLLISVFELIQGRREFFWKCLFVVSAVLGFYSIPVFLYPFSSLFSFGVIWLIYKKDYSFLREFILLSLAVAVLTLILYSPVLLISGWDSLAANTFVLPLSSESFFSQLTYYFKHLASYWWDSEWGNLMTLLAVVPGFIVLLLKRRPDWLLAGICLFIIPFLILLVQRVHPFYRIWDYILILFAILIAFIFDYITGFIRIPDIRQTFLFMIFLLTSVNLYSKVNKFTELGFPYYSQMDQSIQRLIEEEFNTAYISEDTYYLFFTYWTEKENRSVLIDSRLPSYEPDLLILPVDQPFPFATENFTLLEKNKYVSIWIKNRGN